MPKPETRVDPAPAPTPPTPRPEPKAAAEAHGLGRRRARQAPTSSTRTSTSSRRRTCCSQLRESADADAAKELKLKAQRYSQLAKAYNQGMAPGADSEEAFEALRTARTFDQSVGGGFESEISDRLKKIVPGAAISFVAEHELEKAHIAVIVADQLGVSSNINIKAVRSKLEQEAGNIFAQAHSAGFGTSDGKDKLRKIKSIVDSTSPWYQKASTALSGA